MTPRKAGLFGLAFGLVVALAVAFPQPTPEPQALPANVLGTTTCDTLGANVWIRRSPVPIMIETIQHETVHAWQCAITGPDVFNRAASDPAQRERMELEAITLSLRMMGRSPEQCATEALTEAMVYGFPSTPKQLAGKIYLLCADY